MFLTHSFLTFAFLEDNIMRPFQNWSGLITISTIYMLINLPMSIQSVWLDSFTAAEQTLFAESDLFLH